MGSSRPAELLREAPPDPFDQIVDALGESVRHGAGMVDT